MSHEVLFIASGIFDHIRRLFITPPGVKSGGTLNPESAPFTTDKSLFAINTPI
jgi:hypothetical protein